MEVARIKSGVVTREELTKAKTPRITFDDALERFRTKMVVSGCTHGHITLTLRRIAQFSHETGMGGSCKRRKLVSTEGKTRAKNKF